MTGREASGWCGCAVCTPSKKQDWGLVAQAQQCFTLKAEPPWPALTGAEAKQQEESRELHGLWVLLWPPAACPTPWYSGWRLAAGISSQLTLQLLSYTTCVRA